MSNGVQYLPTYRSGFTGPSERIGGSSPYHIDLKILQSLPYEEKIRALDSLANQYKNIGRVIEFSNAGIGGRRWDPAATPEQKKALFEAATGAHAPRPGWDPLDFYVPFAGEDRYGKSVEGASIYIPGVPGGKITRGSGGGYGFFSEATDPSGRVVFRVGHGDINRPEAETEILVAGDQPTTPQTKTADDLLLEKLDELLKPKTQVTSSYQGPSDEQFKKTRDEIDRVTMELLINQAKEKEEEKPAITYQPSTAGPLAAAMAQKAFVTPKSVI